MSFGRRVPMQPRFWVPLLASIVAVAVMVFLAVGYGQSDEATVVSFDDTSPVPSVSETDEDVYGQPDDDSLRVAIAGVLSPSKTLEAYQDLMTYMGEELGREIHLILKPTYAEINDLVRSRRANVALVCTLAYLEGNREFGMELLVAPEMDGETVYYSYLIVPEQSDAASLRDLRGTSFAFTDPISNTGHLAPTYELSLLGETPASFFESNVFTYSHDYSTRAVADGLVEGAAVDSLVYDQMVADEPGLASSTRIVERWGPYGIPPVVVSPDLEGELRRQLLDFFLSVHYSDRGSRILGDLDVDRFVVVPDDLYDSVREMRTELGW